MNVSKVIPAFFSLIRWKNLTIVYATQLLVWLLVLKPFEKWHKQSLFLQLDTFHLLSASTILIAAAGYIINDYFDVKIDLRNKPTKVIIVRIIKKRWAMFWHSLFNILGIAISFYLAYQLNNLLLPILQIISTILLWIYSTHLKRMYVSGNVVVAFLTALSIITIAVYEPSLYPYLNNYYFVDKEVNPNWVIGIYTFFAFMLTWMREIVKDMEDFKGDAEEGCMTMPIKIGLLKSSNFVLLLAVITLLPLFIAVGKLLNLYWFYLSIYILIAIILPLFYFMYQLKKKATQKHYAMMSRYLKLIMVSGLGSLLIFALLPFIN